MNIYQRINAVRQKVDSIRKEKKVEGYMAVTHDQVTALTREHLVEHGVVIVPAGIVRSQTKDTGTFTARGTPFIRFEAVYRFEVVNAEDPQDKFQAEIEAHALDHGDKAPGKALSYAKKALMLKLLEIESFQDEEDREEQFKPKKEAAKSVARGVWDELPKESQKRLTDISILILDFFNEGEDQKAFECYTEHKEKLDVDEQVALWSRFDSTQRSTIKKLGKAWQEAEARRKEAH